MRLQAGRWLGLQPSQASLGVRIPSQVCLLAGDCLLAVGGRPQFLLTCASPQGCSSILATWQLASPRVCDPRASHRPFYDLVLDAVPHPLHHTDELEARHSIQLHSTGRGLGSRC